MCSASWDQHLGGGRRRHPEGRKDHLGQSRHCPGGGSIQADGRGRCTPAGAGGDAGCRLGFPPLHRPCTDRALPRAAVCTLHRSSRGRLEPSHTEGCRVLPEGCEITSTGPRLGRGCDRCSGLQPLAQAAPWAPRVTLIPPPFPPPWPLSALIQHPQSHWGSAAFEQTHLSSVQISLAV